MEEFREEKINWAKERALELLDNGSIKDAVVSFTSDLQKLGLFNPGVEMAISILTLQICMNQIDIEGAKKFINDFN
ncbi:MAG: hypothetical protein QNJ47_28165 [Nostocaceae cyanobacterium]|nr:hypothetical protein [Nostocaceae cyanobacterium]